MQQQYFRALLAEVAQRQMVGPAEGHVVLVHGPGGIGKSTLLQRLHAIAQEATGGGFWHRRGQPQVVFLDWGQGQLKEVVDASAAEGPPLWRVLAAIEIQLGKACGQPAGPAFDNFRTQAAQLPDLVEQAKQHGVLDEKGQTTPVLTPEQVTELVSQLGGLGLKVTGLPGAKAVKGVVGSAVTAGGAVQRLRSGKVTREQFQQLIDAKGALVDAFGQGLTALARRRPVIIVMDTCELLGETLAELGPLSRLGGTRSVWVLGCRLEDGIRAQDSGADRLLRSVSGARLHEMGLQVFDDVSADRYLAGRLPGLNGEQRQRAVRFSRGLPLALALVVQAVEAGMTVAEVCAPLGADGGLPSDVVQRLAERYLTHTRTVPPLRTERTELLALALAQRTDDPDTLAALWDVPVEEVGQVLDRLVAHHDFMRSYRRALHDDVQTAIRNLLLRPEERAALRKANRRAAACLRKRLHNAPYSSVDEQIEDEAWTADAVALLWHTFWADDQEGTNLLLHLLPPAYVHHELPGRLLDIAAFFAPTSPNQTLINELQANQDPLRWRPAQVEEAVRVRQRLLNAPAPAEPVWADTPPAAVFRDHYAATTAQRVGLRWTEASALLQRAAAHTALAPGSITALRLAEVSDLLVPWPKPMPGPWLELNGQELEHKIALRKLAARHRNDCDSYLKLGHSYWNARRWQEAEDAYRQALHHNPTNSSAHNGLGNCHAEADRWDDAEHAYNQALHHNPTNSSAHNGLGNCHLEAGRWDDAEHAYNQALHHNPTNSNAHTSLGNCHAVAGRWDDAEHAYNQALHHDPTNSNAHHGLGVLAWRVRGDAMAAEASWSAALRLRPSDPDAQWRAGLVRLHQGDVVGAEAVLRDGAGDVGCLLLLAVARTRLGREPVADLLAQAHAIAQTAPAPNPLYVPDAFRDAEQRALPFAGVGKAGEGADGMRAAAGARSKIRLFDRVLYEQLAVVIAPEQLEQLYAVWREIIAVDPSAVGGFGPPPPR